MSGVKPEPDEDTQDNQDQSNYAEINVEEFNGSCRAIIKPRGAGLQRTITLEAMSRYYELPIAQAAKQLGVGVTVLKKCCRKFGIQRWPYRKLKSMDKLIESVEQKWCQRHPDDQEKLTEAVTDLRKQKMFMQYHPSLDMESRTKKLRQANFKQEYKWRQTNKRSNSSNDSDMLDYSQNQNPNQQGMNQEYQMMEYPQFIQQEPYSHKVSQKNTRESNQNNTMQQVSSKVAQQIFKSQQNKFFNQNQGPNSCMMASQFGHQLQGPGQQQLQMPILSQALSKIRPSKFSAANDKLDFQRQVAHLASKSSNEANQNFIDSFQDAAQKEQLKLPFDPSLFNAHQHFANFQNQNFQNQYAQEPQRTAFMQGNNFNFQNNQNINNNNNPADNTGYPHVICKGQRQKRYKKADGLYSGNYQGASKANNDDSISQNTLSYEDLDKFQDGIVEHPNQFVTAFSADTQHNLKGNQIIKKDRRSSVLQNSSPRKQFLQLKGDRRKVDKTILDKENIPNFLENAFQFNNGKRKFQIPKELQSNPGAFSDLQDFNLRFRLRE